MKPVILFVALALAACGKDASGPAGVDPTVSITNQTSWPVYFEWRDGQGVVGADTIPGLARRCERFLARADSAYFYMEVTDPNLGGTPRTFTLTQPWFDPTERHAWSVEVVAGGGFHDVQDGTVRAC